MISQFSALPDNSHAECILKGEGLTYSYGTREVLKGVDISIRQGEVLGFLGRNGSGKSTLLSLLIGNTPMQAGSIVFEGQRVHARSQNFRSQIGVVFQRPSLDAKLNAKQNLKLAAKLHGFGGKRLEEAVERGLHFAGLAARAREAVGTFSGGMKRKLDIARALIHDPKLVFLDEPTAGLDEFAFRETWQSLSELKKYSAASVFVVTHRPEESEYCDRLAILSGGVVIACDSPDRLRAQVKNDVVVIKTNDNNEGAQLVSKAFQITPVVAQDEILLESEAGHLLIPRLVDVLGAQNVKAVSLRRASIGDVFLKLTGSNI